LNRAKKKESQFLAHQKKKNLLISFRFFFKGIVVVVVVVGRIKKNTREKKLKKRKKGKIQKLMVHIKKRESPVAHYTETRGPLSCVPACDHVEIFGIFIYFQIYNLESLPPLFLKKKFCFLSPWILTNTFFFILILLVMRRRRGWWMDGVMGVSRPSRSISCHVE
jgi:hypothetical protein